MLKRKYHWDTKDSTCSGYNLKRKLPSCIFPLFENNQILDHLHVNKINFNRKEFALGLALKLRLTS